METDFLGRTYIPAGKRGKYVVINTELQGNSVLWIDELNGRQGDAGRQNFYVVLDGIVPRDISNQDISLCGKDAQGKIKVAVTADVISPTGGRFALTIPQEFYQAAGTYQEAFFAFSNHDNPDNVTTIPIGFKVYENHVAMTIGQSQDYIQTVDKLTAKVSESIQPLDILLTNLQASQKLLQGQIGGYSELIQKQAVATLGADNEFTGKNIFDGPLSGSGIDALKDSYTQSATGLTLLNGFASTDGGAPDIWYRIHKFPSGLKECTLHLRVSTPKLSKNSSIQVMSLPSTISPADGGRVSNIASIQSGGKDIFQGTCGIANNILSLYIHSGSDTATAGWMYYDMTYTVN